MSTNSNWCVDNLQNCYMKCGANTQCLRSCISTFSNCEHLSEYSSQNKVSVPTVVGKQLQTAQPLSQEIAQDYLETKEAI